MQKCVPGLEFKHIKINYSFKSHTQACMHAHPHTRKQKKHVKIPNKPLMQKSNGEKQISFIILNNVNQLKYLNWII